MLINQLKVKIIIIFHYYLSYFIAFHLCCCGCPSAMSSNLLSMCASFSSSHYLFANSILSYILCRVSLSISAKSLLISSILFFNSFISSFFTLSISYFSLFNVSCSSFKFFILSSLSVTRLCK